MFGFGSLLNALFGTRGRLSGEYLGDDAAIACRVSGAGANLAKALLYAVNGGGTRSAGYR